MKYLTERKEIAKALNFNKYPVLTIDMENDKGYGEDFAEGCIVRVEWYYKNEAHYMKGKLMYCEGKLEIGGSGSVLTSGFGYSDVMQMAQNANAPIVKANQEVIVIQEYPSKKQCSVRLMKVDSKIDTHCTTMAKLNDID